jgi:hypothetical protein
VVIIEQHDAVTGQLKRRHELTPYLCVQIAYWNGALNTGQVRAALEQGERISTNFSYFQGEKPSS